MPFSHETRTIPHLLILFYSIHKNNCSFSRSSNFSVAIDLVNQKIACLKDDPQNAQNAGRRSLLDDYLANPKLDMYDIVGMACDLLLAGVDTVSIQTYETIPV